MNFIESVLVARFCDQNVKVLILTLSFHRTIAYYPEQYQTQYQYHSKAQWPQDSTALLNQNLFAVCGFPTVPFTRVFQIDQPPHHQSASWFQPLHSGYSFSPARALRASSQLQLCDLQSRVFFVLASLLLLQLVQLSRELPLRAPLRAQLHFFLFFLQPVKPFPRVQQPVEVFYLQYFVCAESQSPSAQPRAREPAQPLQD